MKWRLPFQSIQEVVYSRLVSHAVGTTLEGKIWDYPPGNAAFPYAVIGDMSSIPNYGKGKAIMDVTVQVDIYSEELGMEQLQTLGTLVSEAVTRAPNLDLSPRGFNCFDIRLSTCQLLREYDGVKLIRRALMTFFLKVEDISS
jgi:hypothetical protein